MYRMSCETPDQKVEQVCEQVAEIALEPKQEPEVVKKSTRGRPRKEISNEEREARLEKQRKLMSEKFKNNPVDNFINKYNSRRKYWTTKLSTNPGIGISEGANGNYVALYRSAKKHSDNYPQSR